MGSCLGQTLVLTESVMDGNHVDFGSAALSAWRYLVPGPGSRVATTGPIHPEHNRALLETFEEVVDAHSAVDADGLLVVPGHESAASIQTHLARGGWAVGFGNTQFPPQCGQQVYVVLPSLANPRFILPRSKLGAALSLYNPSRPMVRLALGVMRGRLASSLAWFGGRVVIAGGAPEHLLVSPPETMAVTLGTESAYQKATVLHLGSDGHPQGYAKLSSRPLASDVLAVETARLEYLSGLSLTGFQVPHGQKTVRWGRERGVFQSAPEKNLGPWKDGLSTPLITALCELFQRTRVERRLEESAFWREMTGWYDTVKDRIPEPWRKRVDLAITRAQSHCGSAAQPVGLAHGDFIDWNLKGAGDDIFLFDWEQSVDEAPPFFDLLHWIVFTHHHVRRKSTPILSLIEGQGPFARACQRVGHQLGLPCSRVHVALYALRTALYHLRAWSEGYESVRDRHTQALHTLGMVLDDVLSSDWSVTSP